ncbi:MULTISPECIES: SDR family oxidoreductase [Virgibacillus]|uniref:SDR family NAD(P)-dependent oxidoreductase n=1 Tax=Virgibacillus TaxID=84406 RepID=UPI00090AA1A0|nr:MULTISPECIES: SDR family oxidoreductase [Virgibacillus]API90472.1 oxidoreductase [Virgibacillus sp. 6R]MBS7429579.1 SDR family oxidoreductase [Virgibacillus sp. 19R1-5]
MKQASLINKKIIITGASSGIGEKLAWHIARNGGVPILLARSQDKLQQLSDCIYQSFHVQSPIYSIDLRDKKAISGVISEITIKHDPIHGLINNAGMGIFSEVKDIREDEVNAMFQLNVTALIFITKQLLPYFQQQPVAHIINIASQAGKVATPKAAIYAATKHAVLGFSNGLRLELAASNIYVTAVNLGPVKTNFFLTADPSGNYEKNVARYILDPDKVAKKIVRYLFAPKREINLPFWMDIGSRIYQMFPTVTEKLLRKQFTRK